MHAPRIPSARRRGASDGLGRGGGPDQVVEIPYHEHRGEPLWLELQDFVEAVRSARLPLVDGHAGVAALALCQRILEAAKQD